MKCFIALSSTKLLGTEAALLKLQKVDGVILYGRNIRGYDSTKKFIREIKAACSDLKIAIDEEGGIVSRFTHLIANYSQPYCSTLSLRKVREYYRLRSEFLRGLGIDVNLAPVVDLAISEDSIMYKRSFGSVPEQVVELASICIEEQQRAGLKSCLKHFPGHGRTTMDSHDNVPVVDISFEEWYVKEMLVFKELFELGIEYVMVGHLLYPQIDQEISSLSKFWIRVILRDKLEYKGIVISDDLCMKAMEKEERVTDESYLDEIGLDVAIITDQKHLLLQ